VGKGDGVPLSVRGGVSVPDTVGDTVTVGVTVPVGLDPKDAVGVVVAVIVDVEVEEEYATQERATHPLPPLVPKAAPPLAATA
jgi:hypothetical protein